MDVATRERQNILVVDDTPANLHLLVHMLRECGFRVRPVPSGSHALRAVNAEPPDLILLDITMPGLDGYEVCRRLKADPATRDIPVLFVSALTETEDKVRAFDAGGVDYVSKPFQLAEVVARVRTHLLLRAQQRELEEGLARERELERLRDKLTQMIAHDMRSPLLALGLMLELVHEAAQPPEADLLDKAQQSLQSIVELVTQMLDVSRLESRALTLRLEPIDVSALAREVLSQLKPLAGTISVSFEPASAAVVQADRDLVRRVIANLVANAFRFANTKVGVTVRPHDPGGVRVEIGDDGQGIAAEHHTKIFEKFGQVEHGQMRVGSGLGLTFAKLAVEAHGGSVGVVSAPGAGSTFWFELATAGARR